MILGVNHFLDMCRTTLNVTGDLARWPRWSPRASPTLRRRASQAAGPEPALERTRLARRG